MEISWRTDPLEDDALHVRTLVARTGMFTAEEIAIAGELVQDRIDRGADSHYELIIAEHGDSLVGYSCYGRVPGTEASFDLYWIAVSKDHQGGGLGRQIIERTERAIRSRRGLQVYAETSGRAEYAPTHRFYVSVGYRLEARLQDFYRPGDDKLIYVKKL